MQILDFDAYVMRHSEGYVQYIVEQAELAHGIIYATPMPLDYRWHVVMNPHMPQLALAAMAAAYDTNLIVRKVA